MLNLRYLFYSLGILSAILGFFFNTSRSYPHDDKQIWTNLSQDQDLNSYFPTSKNDHENNEEELSRNKQSKSMSLEKEIHFESGEKLLDDLLHKLDENDPLMKRLAYMLESKEQADSINKNLDKAAKTKPKIKSPQSNYFTSSVSEMDLLQQLGAYPEIPEKYFNIRPNDTSDYERVNYGLYNDDEYCQLADLYNLEHPENMLKRMTFFTDYDKDSLSRKDVMRKIGHDLSPTVSIKEHYSSYKSVRHVNIDRRTTTFYIQEWNFHYYHKIGRHFLCATQMYNHIPGHGALIRKDLVADNINAYAFRYKDKEFCFNKKDFYPFTYRLYIKEECNEFFEVLKSEQYTKTLKTDSIQYVMKYSERYQHSAFLDSHGASQIKDMYNDGKQCGINEDLIIIQNYITDPLLLDFNNKFNLRIYILISSTNPLIVFYHDGLLRISLFPFHISSKDKSVLLTNTALAKDIYAELSGSTLKRSLHGMTENELRNYQIWTFERLENYLLEIGAIKQSGWVDNYLRPKLKEVAVHLVRMSASSFWSQSNVFELFALDFLVDDQLKLWFMECNPIKSLSGINESHTSYLINMIKDMFEIQYAYYRSRMKRIMILLNRMEAEYTKMGSVNYGKWKERYTEIAKNRLDPEYEISKDNSFEIIIDHNIKGSNAYFGTLKDECADY